MKYWTELINDAFLCFPWFSKDEAKKELGYVPQLSVFSIVGSMIFSSEDLEQFMQVCSETLSKITWKKAIGEEYGFYLFGVIETTDVKSRIFRHQKLWKSVAPELTLTNLNLGPEIEYRVNGKLGYSSIAKFKVDSFYNVLQIVKSNPKKYSIFCSKRHDIMTEDYIKSILEKVYLDDTGKEVNCFKVVLTSCIEGGFVFRWGSSSEECELDIISLEQYINIFRSFSP
ncbi:hypothetical protein [Paenibacillus glufosinatiresistens]|uniref:hypothetical protein n=1 Tax=Paenibacillus glufosinatiresistens TaxID=3070657 RepID=UPI00286D8AEB|nr:hypothetical protein [Paenibacillus sp. YX.27]